MAAVDLNHDEVAETLDQRISASGAGATAPRPELSAEHGLDSFADMRREMRELRRLVENEFGELNWRELGQRHPETRELIRRLMALGLSPDLARRLGERVGKVGAEAELAWRKALYLLAVEIHTFDTDVLERGGTVAVVGPTGVGKTTTIAKLAARFALRHGHRHVGLVTIDNFRIGARDQLHTYGRILNVPVRTAGSAAELDTVLDAMSDRRLILVDTAGMGMRTERFREQVELLQGCAHPITRLLALSANTESQALQRCVRLFAELEPDACVLTKLDEAACLGGLLSTVVQQRLPLAFLADGQRVPEDLQIARAHPLVNRAAELFEEATTEPDTDYLAFAYAGARAHAQL
jgi:flagellar biosynthesis protein FlhF